MTENTEANAAEEPRRSGKRRLVLAAGALLGIGALATSAAFTDFALLDLGAGGLGGADAAYNIQVSTGQEATVDEVARWVEANPDAEPLTIAGADALSPGGAPLVVNVPVRNASQRLGSTLTLRLDNTTVDADAADTAYAGLLRFEYAAVDDASAAPAAWTPIPAGDFAAHGSTGTVSLGDLDAEEGRIVVLRVALADGVDQDTTNAANGGGVRVQARIDGTSR